MVTIRKQDNALAEGLSVTRENWGHYDYVCPNQAYISMDETGFCVRFEVKEADPDRVMTKHYDPVHKDSCCEFFVNFDPASTKWYINFEVNANGVMNPSFRQNRYVSTPLTLDEIASLDIRTRVEPDHWTVTYHIPYGLIKKYFPGFDENTTPYLLGNLYKCGEVPGHQHWYSFFPLDPVNEDFHAPHYFDRFLLER